MLKVFSVYDKAAEAFLQPFFAPTVGIAIRNFRTAANQEDHQFHRHADDYTLFELGEFDESTGKLEPSTPHSLGNALQYVEADNA